MGKILFLVNHEVVIYNFRREMVERFLDEGHQVVISSPRGERIDDLVTMGCQFRSIEISRHGINPIQEWKLFREYVKLIKNEKPDIVLTFTIKPNLYGGMACAFLGVPYVVNITGLGMAVENDGLLQRISVMLYRLALAKVQKVFFQNTENQQFFVRKKLAIGKHDLLPGSGVNLQHFAVMEYPKEETINFVFVSRIMKEKGTDHYLEAAESIRKKYPNTQFHVCGFCEQDYEQRLQKLHEQGIIVYHGMVRDVRTVMRNAHCTIHPTYYPEGMSNILLESAACGRPLITTDRAGCREVIDDGVNGFVVNAQDTQDLIDKIEKFLLLSWEEKKAMGLASRAKVEKGFNRQIVVEKYMDEIRLLSANPDNH